MPRWRAASSMSLARSIAICRDSASTYSLWASCSSITSISATSFNRLGHSPIGVFEVRDGRTPRVDFDHVHLHQADHAFDVVDVYVVLLFAFGAASLSKAIPFDTAILP